LGGKILIPSENQDPLLVSSFLQLLRPGVDLVVKSSPTLPRIDVGSDIDVFSLDINSLMTLFRPLAESNFKNCLISITEIEQAHFHFDVHHVSRGLLFRIDLYGRLPNWARLSVRPGLFDAAIQSGLTHNKSTTSEWPVPSPEFEAVLRYFDFVDSFWVGRDKVHHEEWIKASLNEGEKERFFSMAHHYLGSITPEGPATRARNIPRELFKFRIFRALRPTFRSLRVFKSVASTRTLRKIRVFPQDE